MSGALIAICGLLGLGIVVISTPVVLQATQQIKLRRVRDLHHTNSGQVPRVGGLVLAGAFIGIEVFAALLMPEAFGGTSSQPVVIGCSLAMFGLGFWDDIKALGAKGKLAGQTLIASVVWFAGVGIESIKVPFSEQVISVGGWGSVLTVIWLVGFANLINLIDGIDGLAAGICLMLMGLLVYVGYENGNYELLAAGMAGALLGFLFFNFPPARIYLGDGGAYFLGFQIGLFSLINSHKGTVVTALMAPLFVLALPIADTCLAILRRGLRGLPVFRPDHDHIHHHLLGMGMSRRRVVLSLYGLTLVFLLMGVVAFWSGGELAAVMLGLMLLIFLLCAGKLSFSREWLAVGRMLGKCWAMRGEIRYALSLTNWLIHEGERCGSLEELFLDLTFAARRLGFASGRLELADGERIWSQPEVCKCFRYSRHELLGGASGVLHLQAPICEGKATAERCRSVKSHGDPRPLCAAISDKRVYEIMAELLAESWLKATSTWKTDKQALRFDMSLPVAKRVSRRVLKMAGRFPSATVQDKGLAVLTSGTIAG